MFRWKKTLGALMILVTLAAVGWWQKTPLLAWYYTSRLAGADEANREDWLNRVAGLEDAAISRLWGFLQDNDPRSCENAGAALGRIAQRWGVEDPRSLRLLEDLLAGFDELPTAGRQSLLQVPIDLLQSISPNPTPAGVSLAIGSLLTKASSDAALRHRTLALAGLFVQRVVPGQWFELCRDLSASGLKDADPNHRVQAIRLTMHLAKQSEPRFAEHLLPLLKDGVPQVRRAAVVALGPVSDFVSEDDLLPMLHDPDVEVRRLTQLALRSRGLSDNQLLLAGLISAPEPTVRLSVLERLDDEEGLDVGLWLDRLSRDASPAVRAAALRAAASQSGAELRQRIQQIAQQDASPTVRQLAQYYLRTPPVKSRD